MNPEERADSETLTEIKERYAVDNQRQTGESERISAVLEEVNSTDSVLDIGCVDHSASNEMSERWLHGILDQSVAELVGIDYLPEEVQKLNERGYDVRREDAEDFDIDRDFDVIIAGELIEHLTNPGGFLESVKRHLKPEGKLVLTTPNPWTLLSFRRAFHNRVRQCNPDHVCWYDARTVTQLLNRFGFDSVRIQYIQPDEFGVSRMLHRIGFKVLGSPTLVIVAK